MVPSTKSKFRTGTGTGSQAGSAVPGINPRINFNNLPLEHWHDLDLLPETDVTDTAPFSTRVYDTYWTTFPGEVHDDRRRGRTNRPGASSKPSPMQYDEFFILFLGNEEHQTVGKLFDIIRFGAVSRAKEENLGSSTARRMTGAQAWATSCRHTGGSRHHAITTHPCDLYNPRNVGEIEY